MRSAIIVSIMVLVIVLVVICTLTEERSVWKDICVYFAGGIAIILSAMCIQTCPQAYSHVARSVNSVVGRGEDDMLTCPEKEKLAWEYDEAELNAEVAKRSEQNKKIKQLFNSYDNITDLDKLSDDELQSQAREMFTVMDTPTMSERMRSYIINQANIAISKLIPAVLAQKGGAWKPSETFTNLGFLKKDRDPNLLFLKRNALLTKDHTAVLDWLNSFMTDVGSKNEEIRDCLRMIFTTVPCRALKFLPRDFDNEAASKFAISDAAFDTSVAIVNDAISELEVPALSKDDVKGSGPELFTAVSKDRAAAQRKTADDAKKKEAEDKKQRSADAKRRREEAEAQRVADLKTKIESRQRAPVAQPKTPSVAKPPRHDAKGVGIVPRQEAKPTTPVVAPVVVKSVKEEAKQQEVQVVKREVVSSDPIVVANSDASLPPRAYTRGHPYSDSFNQVVDGVSGTFYPYLDLGKFLQYRDAKGEWLIRFNRRMFNLLLIFRCNKRQLEELQASASCNKYFEGVRSKLAHANEMLSEMNTYKAIAEASKTLKEERAMAEAELEAVKSQVKAINESEIVKDNKRLQFKFNNLETQLQEQTAKLAELEKQHTVDARQVAEKSQAVMDMTLSRNAMELEMTNVREKLHTNVEALKELQKVKDELDKKVDNLQNMVDMYERDIANVEAREATLNADRNLWARKTKELRDQVKLLNNSITKLKKDIEAKKTALLKYGNDIAELKSTIADNRKQLAACNKKIESTEAELSAAKQSVTDCKSERDRLQATIDAERLHHEDQMKNLELNFDTMLILRDKNFTRMRQRARDLDELSNDRHLENRLEIIRDLFRLALDISSTESLLTYMIDELSVHREFDPVGASVDNIIDDYKTMAKDYMFSKDKTKELKVAMAQLQDLREFRDSYNNRVSNLESELRESQARFEQLKSNFTPVEKVLTERLASETATKVALEQRIDQLLHKLQTSEEDVGKANAALDGVKSSLSRLRDTTRNDRKTMQSKLFNTMETQWVEAIKDLQEMLNVDDLNELASKLKITTESAREKFNLHIAFVISQLHKAQKELELSKNLFSDSKAEVARLKKQILTESQKLSLQEATIAELKAELLKKQTAVSGVLTDVVDLKSVKTVTEKNYELHLQLEKRLALLEGDKNNLYTAIDRLRETLATMNVDIELTKSLTKLSNALQYGTPMSAHLNPLQSFISGNTLSSTYAALLFASISDSDSIGIMNHGETISKNINLNEFGTKLLSELDNLAWASESRLDFSEDTDTPDPFDDTTDIDKDTPDPFDDNGGDSAEIVNVVPDVEAVDTFEVANKDITAFRQLPPIGDTTTNTLTDVGRSLVYAMSFIPSLEDDVKRLSTVFKLPIAIPNSSEKRAMHMMVNALYHWNTDVSVLGDSNIKENYAFARSVARAMAEGQIPIVDIDLTHEFPMSKPLESTLLERIALWALACAANVDVDMAHIASLKADLMKCATEANDYKDKMNHLSQKLVDAEKELAGEKGLTKSVVDSMYSMVSNIFNIAKGDKNEIRELEKSYPTILQRVASLMKLHETFLNRLTDQVATLSKESLQTKPLLFDLREMIDSIRKKNAETMLDAGLASESLNNLKQSIEIAKRNAFAIVEQKKMLESSIVSTVQKHKSASDKLDHMLQLVGTMDLKKSAKDKQDQIDQCRRDRMSVARQVRTLEKTIEDRLSMSDVATLAATVDKAKQRLTRAVNSKKAIEADNGQDFDTDQRKQQCDQRIEKLSTLLEEAETKLATAREGVADITHELEVKKLELKSLTDKTKALETTDKERIALLAEEQRQLQESKAELTNSLASKETQLTMLKEQLDQTTTELTQKRNEVSTLQEQGVKTLEELTSKNDQLAALQSQYQESSASLLSVGEQVSALQAQQQELTTQLTTKSEEFTTLQTQRDQLLTEIQSMKEQLASIQERRDQLADESGARNQQIIALQDQLKETKRDQLSSLQTQLTQVTDDLISKTELTSAQEQLNKVTSELTSKSEQLVELQSRHDTLTNELTTLRERVVELQTQHAQLSEELASANEQLVTLREQHAKTLSDADVVKEELASVKSRYDKLSEEMDAKDIRLAELQTQCQDVATLVDDKSRLEEQLAKANADIEVKSSEIAKLVEETKALRDDLLLASDVAQCKRVVNENLGIDVELLGQSDADKKLTIERLNATLADMTQRVENSEMNLDEYKQKASKLQQQVVDNLARDTKLVEHGRAIVSDIETLTRKITDMSAVAERSVKRISTEGLATFNEKKIRDMLEIRDAELARKQELLDNEEKVRQTIQVAINELDKNPMKRQQTITTLQQVDTSNATAISKAYTSYAIQILASEIELESSLNNVNRSTTDVKQSVVHARKALSHQLTLFDDLKSTVSTLREQIALLQSEVNTHKANDITRTQLIEEVSKLESKVAKLEKQLQSEHESARVMREQYATDVTSWERQRQELEANIARITEESHACHAEASRLDTARRTALDSMATNLETGVSGVNNVKASVSALRQQSDALMKAVVRAQTVSSAKTVVDADVGKAVSHMVDRLVEEDMATKLNVVNAETNKSMQAMVDKLVSAEETGADTSKTSAAIEVKQREAEADKIAIMAEYARLLTTALLQKQQLLTSVADARKAALTQVSNLLSQLVNQKSNVEKTATSLEQLHAMSTMERITHDTEIAQLQEQLSLAKKNAMRIEPMLTSEVTMLRESIRKARIASIGVNKKLDDVLAERQHVTNQIRDLCGVLQEDIQKTTDAALQLTASIQNASSQSRRDRQYMVAQRDALWGHYEDLKAFAEYMQARADNSETMAALRSSFALLRERDGKYINVLKRAISGIDAERTRLTTELAMVRAASADAGNSVAELTQRVEQMTKHISDLEQAMADELVRRGELESELQNVKQTVVNRTAVTGTQIEEFTALVNRMLEMIQNVKTAVAIGDVHGTERQHNMQMIYNLQTELERERRVVSGDEIIVEPIVIKVVDKYAEKPLPKAPTPWDNYLASTM